MDRAHLEGGQQWATQIEHAIHSCNALVVGLSPDAVTSPWVTDELLYARQLGKPIIPILLRPVAVIPLLLVAIQYIDLQVNEQQGLQQLRQRLLQVGSHPPLSQSIPMANSPKLQGIAPSVHERVDDPGSKLVALPFGPPTSSVPKALIAVNQWQVDNVHTIVWAPDGQRLATAGSEKIRVWSVPNGKLLTTLETPSPVLIWAPNGLRIATITEGSLSLWDAVTGMLLTIYQNPWAGQRIDQRGVAWAPNGLYIAAPTGWTAGGFNNEKYEYDIDSGIVEVWEISSGKRRDIGMGRCRSISAISWAPNSQQLAAAGHDKTVRVWNASNGRQMAIHKGHTAWIESVAWAPDGQRLATGDRKGPVHVWAATGGKLLATCGPVGLVREVVWAPDGKRLATTSNDGAAHVWEASSGRLLATCGSVSNFRTVAWTPDGQRLTTVDTDNTAHLWEATTGKLIATCQDPSISDKRRHPITWNPDGHYLATASQDGKVLRIWRS